MNHNITDSELFDKTFGLVKSQAPNREMPASEAVETLYLYCKGLTQLLENCNTMTSYQRRKIRQEIERVDWFSKTELYPIAYIDFVPRELEDQKQLDYDVHV